MGMSAGEKSRNSSRHFHSFFDSSDRSSSESSERIRFQSSALQLRAHRRAALSMNESGAAVWLWHPPDGGDGEMERERERRGCAEKRRERVFVSERTAPPGCVITLYSQFKTHLSMTRIGGSIVPATESGVRIRLVND